MKKRHYIFAFISLLVACVWGCQKDPLSVDTEIVTLETTQITGCSVISGGNIMSEGSPTISKRGVCWSTERNPSLYNYTVECPKGGLGRYNCTLTGLEENTTYYVRAFAWNSFGAIYGEEMTFTTPYKPVFSQVELVEYNSTSATVKATIEKDGNATICKQGVCFSEKENPTIADNIFCVESENLGIGEFPCVLNDLKPGTYYYIRPFATNAAGTSYAEQISFMTPNTPTLKQTEILDYTQSTALVLGTVVTNAGADIFEKGFCWSIKTNPTIEDNHITISSVQEESFEGTITELANGTTYYVRSYAINSVGIAYGEEISFVTWKLPTIATSLVTNIKKNSVDCGGVILSDGGTTIIEYGLCWSSLQNPMYENDKIILGNGKDAFSRTIDGLEDGKIYYTRAYAINAVGIVYGEERMFTTLTTPTVADVNVSNISYTYAAINSEILFDGGSDVTERGFCWSTSLNPSIDDNKRIIGSGLGEISISIVDLLDNTTYYVCAYAINSAGISYGTVSSFATIEITSPTVQTNVVTGLSYTSATFSGEVLQSNGSEIIERGFCWSTSANPTITDNKKVVSGGLGEYSSVITGLADNTTYYVRSYATNGKGTFYGEERVFSTLEIKVPSVMTLSVYFSSYNIVIFNGKVLSSNGSKVIEYGFCWGTNENPTILDNRIVVNLGTSSFNVQTSSFIDNTIYYVCAYAINDKGIAYGNVESFYERGAFSVSEDNKVFFSQGNLQYQASTKEWRFAEKQYDIIGNNNSNKSYKYNGWIDLFCWGTSGWNSGARRYEPYVRGSSDSDFWTGNSTIQDLTGSYAKADWGVYNKISNGGNMVGMWRTLSNNEWYYLLFERTNASVLIGYAIVNGINGIVLLPDNWSIPKEVTFNSGIGEKDRFTNNKYTEYEWNKLEKNGAIFLPAAGLDELQEIRNVGNYGNYWSSSAANCNNGYRLIFTNGRVEISEGNRSVGRSVRLVQDVK